MTVDPVAARAFDAMAEEYERGRPGWPADAIAALLERLGARTVLDLAAGTGKLTEVLAGLADAVVAVEPVDGMRRVLAARLPGVRTLTGTAEAIPLPDGSVDAVFVAEAFHWFDLERAPAEIARVLRPGGGLAVMWNEASDEGEPWFDELVALVVEHRLAGSGGTRRDTVPWRKALQAEPRLGPLTDEDVAHEQAIDRDRIVDQIASFSSIGSLPADRREAALAAVRELLDRHGVDAVTLRYRAMITTTRRLDG
jgi:ubiquinone/menaquinone biosynthesis C-methylase UbiE